MSVLMAMVSETVIAWIVGHAHRSILSMVYANVLLLITGLRVYVVLVQLAHATIVADRDAL